VEAESGSRIPRAVAAADIGLSRTDWDASLQVEAFFEPLFEAKDAIEHKGYMTGAQSMLLLKQLSQNHYDDTKGMSVKSFPATCSKKDRERTTR
jgi:hypothetical protein